MELTTQGDGATVGLKEANDFVKGKISTTYGGPEAGRDVLLRAVDYTKGGDENEVAIHVEGSKLNTIKKKYLQDVIREGQELNEYGVYNSENDVNNNVKTSENKPSNTEAFLSMLIDAINGTIGDLAEIKNTIEEKSHLSFDSVDVCIAELETYKKSLEDEANKLGSENT